MKPILAAAKTAGTFAMSAVMGTGAWIAMDAIPHAGHPLTRPPFLVMGLMMALVLTVLIGWPSLALLRRRGRPSLPALLLLGAAVGLVMFVLLKGLDLLAFQRMCGNYGIACLDPLGFVAAMGEVMIKTPVRLAEFIAAGGAGGATLSVLEHPR
jgi:hypothetical protein